MGKGSPRRWTIRKNGSLSKSSCEDERHLWPSECSTSSERLMMLPKLATPEKRSWPLRKPSFAMPLRKRSPPAGPRVLLTRAALRWKGLANVAPLPELAGLSLTSSTTCEMLGVQKMELQCYLFQFPQPQRYLVISKDGVGLRFLTEELCLELASPAALSLSACLCLRRHWCLWEAP